MAALGRDRQGADRDGAAQLIFEQPFGKILAILLVIGLAGYVIWRLIEGIKDPHHRGSDAKGILKRAGYIFSGLAYAAFAFSLVRLITGSGQSSGGGTSRKSMAAKMLATDWGPYAVAAIGLVVMCIGIRYLYKAYQNNFVQKLNVHGVQTRVKKWISRIGQIGYAARGIVWLIIGFFALKAGITSNASEVKSSSGAFSFIEQSTGSMVLLIIAIGVIAYGIYMFVKAKYYRIRLHG
jgi:flagellar biogenesis protein FliO